MRIICKDVFLEDENKIIMGIIVLFFFYYLLLKSYKNGVIYTACVLQFFTFIGVTTELKVFVIMVALILITRIFKGKPKNCISKYPTYFVLATLCIISSYIVTTVVNNFYSYKTVCSNILTYFVFPFLFFEVINTKKDFIKVVRCLVIVFCISTVYTFIEEVLSVNIITLLWNKVFSISGFIIDSSEIRYGVKRCNSIFAYFSSLGYYSVMMFSFLFFLKYKYKIKNTKIDFLIYTLPLCAFMTGSRAVYLGLMASVMFTFLFTKNNYYMRIVVIVILLIPLLYPVFVEIFNSIFNSDSSSAVSGSSQEMRNVQLAICLKYQSLSPLFGNGRMYIWNVVSPNETLLLGAESIWFSLLVDFGYYGCVCYCLFLFFIGAGLYKLSKVFIVIPIIHLLILSLSPDFSIEYNYLLFFSILLVKSDFLLVKNS